MTMQTYHGSCHCKAVRFTAAFDLANGTHRCNCSICWKSRAWFAIVQKEDFTLLAGSDALSQYAFAAGGRKAPELTYRFCKYCGTRIHAEGDMEDQGGKFYALHVPTLDDATQDELAAAPMTFMDNLHDRPRETSADTRLL